MTATTFELVFGGIVLLSLAIGLWAYLHGVHYWKKVVKDLDDFHEHVNDYKKGKDDE